jgi:hypothetical protein
MILLLLSNSACQSVSESQREQALVAVRSVMHNDYSGTRPQGDMLQLAGWYRSTKLTIAATVMHSLFQFSSLKALCRAR